MRGGADDRCNLAIDRYWSERDGGIQILHFAHSGLFWSDLTYAVTFACRAEDHLDHTSTSSVVPLEAGPFGNRSTLIVWDIALSRPAVGQRFVRQPLHVT